MTLHIIKLCVGLDTLSELAAWQAQRLDERRRAGEPAELLHITRHTPRRAAEILPGGSLYWVIKGQIAARQRLLEFRPTVRDGVDHCALVFDAELVAVEPRLRRPFQGWRYFEEKDAPKDIGRFDGSGEGSESLRHELVALGLL